MMGARSRVPLVRGHLGSALYGERVIFGRETVEIRAHDASRWLGIFGIREYPALTRPGQMNALLGQDFAFVVSQSFTFMGKARPAERLRRRDRKSTRLNSCHQCVTSMPSSSYIHNIVV